MRPVGGGDGTEGTIPKGETNMETEQENAVECGKFKVELRGVGKRVVVIPVHVTLEEVHAVVQALFCWYGGHLWEFRDFSGRRYGDKCPGPLPFAEDEEDMVPPSAVCLSDVLPERGDKLRYTYDFGADWVHVITRMTDPKAPGRYCVKTEGPDGIEDCGGARGFQECKDEWYVPDAEEITARLEGLKLNPRKTGTGLLKKSEEALAEAIRALSPAEWKWLCELGREGGAGIGRKTKRIDRLVQLLPGVLELKSLSSLLGCFSFHAEPEFKRLWRKKGEEWARLRGEAE